MAHGKEPGRAAPVKETRFRIDCRSPVSNDGRTSCPEGSEADPHYGPGIPRMLFGNRWHETCPAHAARCCWTNGERLDMRTALSLAAECLAICHKNDVPMRQYQDTEIKFPSLTLNLGVLDIHISRAP